MIELRNSVGQYPGFAEYLYRKTAECRYHASGEEKSSGMSSCRDFLHFRTLYAIQEQTPRKFYGNDLPDTVLSAEKMLTVKSIDANALFIALFQRIRKGAAFHKKK